MSIRHSAKDSNHRLAVLIRENSACVRRRPNCVGTLCIFEDHSSGDKVQLPAAVTGAVFCSQSSSLVKLKFLAVDAGMIADQFAALTALTRLTYLEVRTDCTFHLHMLKQHSGAVHFDYGLLRAVTQYTLAV